MQNTSNWYYAIRRTVALVSVLGIGSASPLVVDAQGGQTGIEAPTFRVDPSWPRPLPDRWVFENVGGVCVDAQDHVFIISHDRPTDHEAAVANATPPVVEFDPDGNVLNSWGNRDLLPEFKKSRGGPGPHGCFVDYEGNVWIAGNYDAIVQKYSHDGSKLLLQIGTKEKFDSSDGTASGTPTNSSHQYLNAPANMAVDPANGDVYVADGYANDRVVVFDREGHYLRQWGRKGTIAEAEAGVPGVFVKCVHCIRLANDGLVYVCDREGDRIEVFDKMGEFRRNIYVKKGTGAIPNTFGSAWEVAFSPDQAQKYMYVADGGNEAVWIIDRASGQILSSFGRSGHQVGDFTFLHNLAVDSRGDIITGEATDGRRAQRFKLINGASPR